MASRTSMTRPKLWPCSDRSVKELLVLAVDETAGCRINFSHVPLGMLLGQYQPFLLKGESSSVKRLLHFGRRGHVADTYQGLGVFLFLISALGGFQGRVLQIVTNGATPARIGDAHSSSAQNAQVTPQGFLWSLAPARFSQL